MVTTLTEIVVAPEVTHEPPKPTTIAETLDKAADLLEKGWIQNLLFNAEMTSFCAIGAIGHVHEIHPNMTGGLPAGRKRLADRAAAFLSRHLGLDATGIGIGQRNSIAYWNNASGRKQEEVVAAFRGAALEAYEQGV